MKIDNLDKSMVNKILQEITIAYPFSFDDIQVVFEFTKSFDATIQACDVAVNLGVASLIRIINLIQDGPAKKSTCYTPLIPKIKD